MGSVGGSKTAKYIRFGEIPENGRSINFLAMSYDEQREITSAMNAGLSAEEAIKEVLGEKYIDKVLEHGVSVFKMDSDGLPKIENLQQAMSLVSRLDSNVYEVNGSEVTIGQDDEPVISVDSYKKTSLTKEKLIAKVEKVLSQNYNTVKVDNDYKPDPRRGEAINEYTYNDWGRGEHRYPDDTVYITFHGKEYSNPKSTWDTSTGPSRKKRK